MIIRKYEKRVLKTTKFIIHMYIPLIILPLCVL